MRLLGDIKMKQKIKMVRSKEGVDGKTVKAMARKIVELEQALKMLYAVTGKIVEKMEKGQNAEPEIKLAPLNPEDYKLYIG
jgi:hypothetical protein